MNWTKLTLAAAASLAMISGAGAMIFHEGIEEIMEKGFKKGGLRQQIDLEVKKDAPDWDEVKKKSEELSKLCESLCREKQPEGEADSWKKLTEELLKNSKSLHEAADRKNQEQARSFIGKINSSCKECHDLHRP